MKKEAYKSHKSHNCTKCEEKGHAFWHCMPLCTKCYRKLKKHEGGKLKYTEDGKERRTKGGAVGCPEGWKKADKIAYYQVG